jgi:chromate transporter
VAVVAHALLGMARALAPDLQRAVIAGVAAVLALAIPHAFGQILAIAAGGVAGFAWLKLPSLEAKAASAEVAAGVPVGRSAALFCLGLFFALLLLLPVLAGLTGNAVLRLVDSFYRAGALVFGGGHVVLPLLQAEMVGTGLVDREAFLAGYGAAQAVPGPLFSFAAYLGAVALAPPNGIAGAAIALVSIFLPSALLIVGALPLWERLRRAPAARRALTGVNAAVVGLLAAALYDPVITAGIGSWRDAAITAAALGALGWAGVPAWAVVIAAGLVGGLAF